MKDSAMAAEADKRIMEAAGQAIETMRVQLGSALLSGPISLEHGKPKRLSAEAAVAKTHEIADAAMQQFTNALEIIEAEEAEPPIPTCPKCGDQELEKRYSAAGKHFPWKYVVSHIPQERADEHMDWICKECGYAWEADCLDVTPRTVDITIKADGGEYLSRAHVVSALEETHAPHQETPDA